MDLESLFRLPGLVAGTGDGWSAEIAKEASASVSSPRTLSADCAGVRARTWFEALLYSAPVAAPVTSAAVGDCAPIAPPAVGRRAAVTDVTAALP